MGFKRFLVSIASKIFGLAVALLTLTIALSLFLLAEVGRSRADIAVISGHDLPLAAAIEELNEAGLRRRLAFTRWYGALCGDTPNAEIVAEASANYASFTPKLTEGFARIRTIIGGYPAAGGRAVALAEIGAVVSQIEAAYPAITRRQHALLELQKQGKHAEADALVNVLDDSVRQIQTARSELAAKVRRLTSEAADAARARQERVQRLTMAATASAVALGLVIATWVTRRLTLPIRSLAQAVDTVRTGNLEVRLPLQSRDEIGALTDSFNFFVQELRAKEEIKRTFGKYVDPRVLERMLLDPGAQGSAGEKRVMTVSFADLAGFTRISEHLTPGLLVNLLNRHFGLQAQCVQNHLGIVDKYIGDAIMAFWGPPFVSSEEQPVLACRAALCQVGSLATLETELPDLIGLRKRSFALECRIGICTGEVLVGNIGSELSRSYTVIGDTVNLASRLEGVNKVYGIHVLLDEATAAGIRGSFETREIDTVAVKGREEAVRIFELLGVSGGTEAGRLRLRDRYETGLGHYRSRRWADAATAFRSGLEIDPADQPSRLMLERCETLAATPPAGAWDGVWRLTAK